MSKKNKKTYQTSATRSPNTKQVKDRKKFLIDFMGKNKIFALLSLLLVIGSIAMIVVKGLNYGIDFSGGTEIQVQFPDGSVRYCSYTFYVR